MTEELLVVRRLKKYYPIKKGLFRSSVEHKAVDDVSFTIRRGETFGLVGESGSGKSTIGRSVLRLVEPTAGDILFEGKNVALMSPKELRELRKAAQMIFQDPFASLNPRHPVHKIIEEPFIVHSDMTAKERAERVAELLDVVGLNRNHAKRYPREFSGGQRQRIGIARALAIRPKLIVADEPVSALDVSIQSQIINLLQDLQDEFELTYLFIAHDLSVVKHICDRIGVMRAGRLVEIASKKDLYANPLHPYTQTLLSSAPIPDPEAKRERILMRDVGFDSGVDVSGCSFQFHCPSMFNRCKIDRPLLKEAMNDQYVACHLYD